MRHGLHHGQRALWCHVWNALLKHQLRCLGFNPLPQKKLEAVSPSSLQPTPHVCAPHDQALNPLPVISKAALSSEECGEAGPLLILRMFWYFGLDLRWTIQASGKYRADCEILALLLQGITWACLKASLKALNAFHPAAMPLFPGTGLSVKLVFMREETLQRRSSDVWESQHFFLN